MGINNKVMDNAQNNVVDFKNAELDLGDLLETANHDEILQHLKNVKLGEHYFEMLNNVYFCFIYEVESLISMKWPVSSAG
jgi:hypothetical protein